MQEKLQKFYDYLDSLLQSYTRLADTLRGKIDAVERDDLDQLSEIMKDEQAYVLLSRGFDDHLAKHREELGLHGATLSEVISQMPGDWQPKFHTLYLNLRSKLDEVKGLNQICQGNLETKLEILGRNIRAANPTSTSHYTDEKKIMSEPKTSLFDKSI